MKYYVAENQDGYDVVLVIEGHGEVEAFELGQLETQLQAAEISHGFSYCDPPRLKICLKETQEDG